MGNPDWARAPNMATVREVIFILRPLPLLAHQIAVPTIVVDSPAVWLERLADKRNNWTFDTGPKTGKSKWELDIGEVVLQRGNLALADAAEKIDMQATLDTVGDQAPLRQGPRRRAGAADRCVGRRCLRTRRQGQHQGRQKTPKDTAPDSRYGIRWKAVGHYNQATINASGKAGTVLSLRDVNTPYPVQADVRVGATRAVIEGTLTNPAHLGALDVNLMLSGDNMAKLYALTGIVLPSTPPYETRGRLVATLKKGRRPIRIGISPARSAAATWAVRSPSPSARRARCCLASWCPSSCCSPIWRR